MSTGILLGFMTTPDRTTAEQIVDHLVQERLIACGNISADVSSIFRWQGAVERADEVLIIMKTTAAQGPRVAARVRELHPYEVPEVLFFPVTIGNDAYVQWVHDSVVSPQDTEG